VTSAATTLHHEQPALKEVDVTRSLTIRHQFPHINGAYRHIGGNALVGRIATLPPPTGVLDIAKCPTSDLDNDLKITPRMHKYLVENFFNGIHQIYPILDPRTPVLLPNGEISGDISPNDAFSLQMMYSISCLSSPEHEKISSLGASCYRRALLNIENAMVEPSFATLQIAALLALHSLLDPSSGNIGQHVGFAVRLSIGLADTDGPDASPFLWAIYPVVYSIENQVSTVLDRINTFPEPLYLINFVAGNDAKFMCSLYRLQSRFRNNVSTNIGASIKDALAVIEKNTTEERHPNIVSTVYETQMLIEPSQIVAIRLLQSYMHPRFIATFVTAHWIYLAGTSIKEAFDIEGIPRYEMLKAFGMAVSLLTKYSLRWPGAEVMLESLNNSVEWLH
jgi:hypothetical protein